MKKTLLLFFAIVFPLLSFSQVAEIVSENWFLRSLSIDNQTSYAPYNEDFNIIFDEDGSEYTAGANGVENFFSSTLVFNETNETLEFTTVSITLLGCEIENCDYENLYFYEFLTDSVLTLKTFDFIYLEFSSGLKSLRLTDAEGNVARYYNQPITPPATALFQTFYLYSTDVDLGESTFIQNYDPPIQPTITINEDLSFSGLGSCNTFTGQFEYTENSFSGPILFPVAFEPTSNECEFHTDFENYYFSQFGSGNALYMQLSGSTEPGNSFFSFELIAGYNFNFFNEPVLSVNGNSIVDLYVYPNPTNDILYIQNLIRPITSISIMDVNGKLLKKGQPLKNEIDVSSLQSGVYFLELVSEGKQAVRKFIKR